MKILTLTTGKMPAETQQQYIAWLLYCEAGSLEKLLRQWNELLQPYTEIVPKTGGLGIMLGAVPAISTLKNWSIRYRWVQRRELKIAEDMESVRKRIREIWEKKVYYIAEMFWNKIHKVRQQMREGERATVDEVKTLWEMFRVEMGEPIGKQVVAANEYQPDTPDPEQDEFMKAANEFLAKRLALKAKTASENKKSNS